MKTTMSLTPLSKVPDLVLFFLVTIFNFISPMLVSFGFLMVLVLVDFISGLMVSKRDGGKFSMLKAINSLRKAFAYLLLCSSGFLMDMWFFKQMLGAPFMFNTFMCIVALIEFKSIVENTSRLLGVDIWTKIIKAFGKKVDIE